jgi:hypothetical protein
VFCWIIFKERIFKDDIKLEEQENANLKQMQRTLGEF